MVNVAKNRPAVQSSTEWGHEAKRAVDSSSHGHDVSSCSKTQRSTRPWWRVDLGESVWVEKVLIANTRKDYDYQELSNVNIRIGMLVTIGSRFVHNYV